MKPLNIAFIGYNRKRTHDYFEELFVENLKDVKLVDLKSGVMILKDGTIIRRVDDLDDCAHCRFDQIIIADDSRMNVLVDRADLIAAVELTMLLSCVPEDFQRMFYNTDFKEE